MILVKKVDGKIWKETMSENAHLSVFDETWSKELERVDFALLMIESESNTVISYATAQEVDKNTVYLQYGGALPSFKGTVITYKSFCEMLELLKEKYTKIVTLVENTNYPMLKFYMKQMFKVTGIRYFKNSILLENSYEIAS